MLGYKPLKSPIKSYWIPLKSHQIPQKHQNNRKKSYSSSWMHLLPSLWKSQVDNIGYSSGPVSPQMWLLTLDTRPLLQGTGRRFGDHENPWTSIENPWRSIEIHEHPWIPILISKKQSRLTWTSIRKNQAIRLDDDFHRRDANLVVFTLVSGGFIYMDSTGIGPGIRPNHVAHIHQWVTEFQAHLPSVIRHSNGTYPIWFEYFHNIFTWKTSSSPKS